MSSTNYSIPLHANLSRKSWKYIIILISILHWIEPGHCQTTWWLGSRCRLRYNVCCNVHNKRFFADAAMFFISVFPDRCDCDFKSLISIFNLVTNTLNISCRIVFRRFPMDHIDNKATLVLVMASWCCQTRQQSSWYFSAIEFLCIKEWHYMKFIASHFRGNWTAFLAIDCSGSQQKNNQSSALLFFCEKELRSQMDSFHKASVMPKAFPCYDVTMVLDNANRHEGQQSSWTPRYHSRYGWANSLKGTLLINGKSWLSWSHTHKKNYYSEITRIFF